MILAGFGSLLTLPVAGHLVRGFRYYFMRILEIFQKLDSIALIIKEENEMTV